jgi:Ca2+:H+ antiporter
VFEIGGGGHGVYRKVPRLPVRPSLYWLLVFVPVSLVAVLFVHEAPVVFVTSSLAIVPLAGLIGRSTDSLATHAGPRVGGLLNATFGNLTEVVVAVMLVSAGEFVVVKASLIGSIIGNIVLVMGAAAFAGGLRRKELEFSMQSAGMQTSSLLLAVLALMMPALFVQLNPDTYGERLVISVVVASVLIVLYGAALVFTYVTHAHLFRVPGAREQPEWSMPRSIAVLAVSGVVVGIESEFLTSSIEPTVQAFGISRVFIGMFVVAIVGNAAEHASAVMFALRDKMDVALEIAFGSASQIALFVAPLLVFVSLIIGRPMDFVFSPFEVAAVALSTIIVAVAIRDGRTNWLEGLQLLGAYVILAVSFFFVP